MMRRLFAAVVASCVAAGCGYDGVAGPVPENVGSLLLSARTTDLEAVGDSVELTARLVGLEDTIPIDPVDLTYETSDARVLIVDGRGVAMAQGTGSARVEAVYGPQPDATANLTFDVAGEGPLGPPIVGGELRCTKGRAGPFPCGGITLLSYLPHGALGVSPGTRLNDMWGWTAPDSGTEYALVAHTGGVVFVDLGDPTRPRVVGALPTAASFSTWRDVKVYADHALIVSDANHGHGMQIFDLRVLPITNSFTRFAAHGRYEGFHSAHNLAVNEVTGFAYAVGTETCGRGLHMIDVSNLADPTFVGCQWTPGTGRSGGGYTHDAQCLIYDGPDADYRGREICLASNETHIVLVDVTDKGDPATVATATYPGASYVHQGWLTGDRRYFLQNDELDEGPTRTMIWDVSDLDDPIKMGEYLGSTDATDHNLFILEDLAYLSNYTAGLHVLDVSSPASPEEVAYFDTVPDNDDHGYHAGSWSNYPFFESGIIAVTSGYEGLFILRLESATD